ncbi:MAG TPA: hypothetical protein VKK31_11710 [Thermoanaerobaculia bacterium]|nr:hypothetical protein [Thermoanaerobaculia bacterium]
MASTTFRRLVAVFVLGAFLGMPLASVAGPRVARRSESQEISLEPFARLWSFLTRVWAKEGCRIDPSGRCLDDKNGCSVDPNGRCLVVPEVTLKNGCSIDPYGRCLPG